MGDFIDGGRPDRIDVTLEGDEAKYVVEAAAEFGLSHRALVRQALRLYQLHNRRLAEGETVTWSGDAERAAAFRGPTAGGGA